MIRIINFPRKVIKTIQPPTKLKPLAATLLEVSNALWQRPDSLLRRIRGEI